MKDKKIGVCTLRGQVRNYGCALQAYALHKEFEKLGYHSEIINLEPSKKVKADNKIFDLAWFKQYSPTMALKLTAKRIDQASRKKAEQIIYKKDLLKFEKHKQLRHEAFDKFDNEYIPKGSVLYSADKTDAILAEYDIFVSGSDQVWNPRWYNEFYRMDFVPDSFPKFSYAASVSVNSLTDAQKETFKKSLSSYIGVSVREEQSVSLLEELSPVLPVHSLDPTLLLGRSDWDAVASERLVSEPYLFCYYLDCGKKLRKLAKDYAKKRGLRVVCIPYIMNKFNKYERKYTDEFVDSAAVGEFVSLIKHADVVFTDSFHASVFSSIYEKEFFVFRRYGFPGMNVRVKTLTDMFGTEERYCDTDEKETVSYLEKCTPVDYSKQEKYTQLKEKSVAYLAEMLEKSERMVK